MDRHHKLARFKPLRRASTPRFVLLWLIGPLLWLGALILVATVVRRGYAIAVALIVLAASILIALAVLVPMRIQRGREDRKS